MSAEVPGPSPEALRRDMGNSGSIDAMRHQFLGETAQATPEAQKYMIETRGLEGVGIVSPVDEQDHSQVLVTTESESPADVTWESIAKDNFDAAMVALEAAEGADYHHRVAEPGLAQTQQSEVAPVIQPNEGTISEVTQDSPAQTAENTAPLAPKKHGRRAADSNGNDSVVFEGRGVVPDGSGKHRAGPRTTDALGVIPENMEPVSDVIGQQMDRESVSDPASQVMSEDELEVARRDAYEQSRGIGVHREAASSPAHKRASQEELEAARRDADEERRGIGKYLEQDNGIEEHVISEAAQDELDADRNGHDRGEDVNEFRKAIRGLGSEDKTVAGVGEQNHPDRLEATEVPEALKPMFDAMLAQNALLAKQIELLTAQNAELSKKLGSLEGKVVEDQPAVVEEEPDADRDGTRGEALEEYRRQIRGVGVEDDTIIEADEPAAEPVEPVEPGTTPRGFRNRLKNIFRKVKDFPLWLATKTQNGINRTAEFYNDPEKGRRRKVATAVGAGALLLAGGIVLWARSKGHEVDSSALSYDTPMDQLAKDIAGRDPVDIEAARAASAEALARRTLDINSEYTNGFIRAIGEKYGTTTELAEGAYHLVEEDLRGLQGTFVGPNGDVRISEAKPFELPVSVYLKVQEYLKSHTA